MYKLNVNFLHTHELEYEIKSRGLTVPVVAVDRRRVLRGALSQEAANRSICTFIDTGDFDGEIKGVEETVNDLKIKINDFSGADTDVEYARLICRLTHVTGRVKRLSCIDDDQEKIKKDWLSEIFSLEGDLDAKVHPVLPRAHSTPTQNATLGTQFPFSKQIPVHKWGIHFSGTDSNESVVSFLERIECLRVARGVSDGEIFSCAAEIFQDKAFTWYLNNRGKFNSWAELIVKLKSDFLPYNYQDDLLEEIKARKQLRNEKVTIYINVMCGLLNRLETKLDEKTMVRYVRRNLLSFYSQPLALIDIPDIDTLTERCKQLEETLTWSQNSYEHHSRVYREPDLSMPTSSSANKNFRKNISTVSSNVKCWNCGQIGHVYSKCSLSRKLFCYGCGKSNVIKTRCSSCSKNVVDSGVSLDATNAVQMQTGQNSKKGKNIVKSTEQKASTSQQSQIVDNSALFKSAPDVASLLYRKVNDNRPYLDIDILGKKIPALLDSGSNISLIGSKGLELLEKDNLNIIFSESIKVTTADGKIQDLIGYSELKLTVGNVSKKIRLYIIPSVTHCVILGMDFLRLFKVNNDFSKFSFNVTSLKLAVVNAILDISHLTSDQREQMDNVIEKFKLIGPTDKLGLTDVVTHVIDTGDAPPFRQKQYPLPQAMQEHLEKEIDNLLRLGVIRESNSPYCSPVWLVTKSNGSYRICFDGRKLNSITINKSGYPLPSIEIILSKLRDSKYITSIDLKHAFYQIPLEESSRPKTAFAVRGKGLFEFVTMPFGLVTASNSMAKLMDLVIGPSLEPFCFYYLDDLIICTPTFEKQVQILNRIFERLRKANLTINLEKCNFCRPSLRYLGYVVDEHGLRTDPEKVSSICDFPVPKTTSQVRRLIGMVGYYRRFLKNFSSLSSPITDLLRDRKKGQPITWTPEADRAFQEVKHSLTSAPILSSPDFNKPFLLMCDGSDVGVGCVLFQEEDGLEHPIAYASKKLNKCQKKYTTTEKELLAVLFGIEHFRYYLVGRKFTVISDHSSLVWLNNMKKPSPRLARWILQLAQYDFKIIHRKASGTVVADALSRIHDVNVLDVAKLQLDKWYRRMLQQVIDDPDRFPTYKVDNGVLYKHIFNNVLGFSNMSNWKIVIPTRNRREVLSQYHNNPIAAHFGVYKTLGRISELYYWPGMRKSVVQYVRKCKTCAACKPSNLPQAGLMGSYRNIGFPFQLISCDLLGPYPRSRKGNQFVLVVVDWFTKFTLVNAMAKATAPGIGRFLENQVFLVFGVPQIISCDNGKQFTCKLFKDFLSKYQVQKTWYNANFHPQINHTERVNKSILRNAII